MFWSSGPKCEFKLLGLVHPSFFFIIENNHLLWFLDLNYSDLCVWLICSYHRQLVNIKTYRTYKKKKIPVSCFLFGGRFLIAIGRRRSVRLNSIAIMQPDMSKTLQVKFQYCQQTHIEVYKTVDTAFMLITLLNIKISVCFNNLLILTLSSKRNE